MIIKIDKNQLKYPTLFTIYVARFYCLKKCSERNSCNNKLIFCDKTIDLLKELEIKTKVIDNETVKVKEDISKNIKELILEMYENKYIIKEIK